MKVLAAFAIAVLVILSGCGEGDVISNPNPINGLENVVFKYEYLNSTPQYCQSLMLTGTETNLYLYGAYSRFFVYDLGNNSWSKTVSYPQDTVGWRWDGAIGYINGKVYVVATPINNTNYDSFPKYYNILEVDPTTGSTTALPELLPFRRWSYYPAYGVYGEKIAIVFQNMDSVYVFDAATKKGTFVAQNILKMPVGKDNNPCYSYGMQDENLYVFKWSTKEFYRFSMKTYRWDKIEIDSQILSLMPSYVRGGMFNGLFCLWGSEMNFALVYNTTSGKWIEANKDLPNDNFLLRENSFFATSDALYVVEVFSRNLWRITLAKN